MGNCRKTTRGLTKNELVVLSEGWHHAARLGLRLNLMLTLRPLDEDMTPSDHCRAYAALRNKVGVYARQHGFRPAFIWSREANPDGEGEHLHMLVHVPEKWRKHFIETAIGWWPGPGEMDIRPASQKTVITDDGMPHSALTYLCKQMDNRTRWKRGLRYQKGGEVLGKRAGVSATLSIKAIEDYRAQPIPLRAVAGG